MNTPMSLEVLEHALRQIGRDHREAGCVGTKHFLPCPVAEVIAEAEYERR